MVRFTVDNRNRLVFYGNMVGYVKNSTAVVDEMFQTDELTRYLNRLSLTPQWEDGVFDRLATGEVPSEDLGQPLKGCQMRQPFRGCPRSSLGTSPVARRSKTPSSHWGVRLSLFR